MTGAMVKNKETDTFLEKQVEQKMKLCQDIGRYLIYRCQTCAENRRGKVTSARERKERLSST